MTTKKTALITGAGRNIGRAIALGLAEDGFNVVINGSSDRAAAEAVAAEARAKGVGALVAMGDVGSPEDTTESRRRRLPPSARLMCW